MTRAVPIILAAFLLSSQVLGPCHAAATTEEEGKTVPDSAPSPLPAEEYLVSPKDVLQITVVGEPDLPMDFEVSSQDGSIKYPYIEYVKVAGLTVKQIAKLITDLLTPDWFVAPQVNVVVSKYSEKIFYVEGQVNRPGKFSFTGQNKMTVYRAITTAGGFTRIAKKKVILITSDDRGKERRLEVDVGDIIKNIEKNPELDPPIKANDIVHVPESWL